MTARYRVGLTLVALGALSLACAQEKSTGPRLSPEMALQGNNVPPSARFYVQHNIASDLPGLADFLDPDLVNGWGLVASATSPWWIADNGTDLSTLYNGNTGAKLGLRVHVVGAPTGVVFNGGAGFVVVRGAKSGPARFIFATESGTIAGWNPGVIADTAVVAVDSSSAGAIYKGLAIATTAAGDRLYATNFHAGRVEAYDASFHGVAAAFSDPSLPAGFAPFGIRTLGGAIYVTYALQDDDAEDDVAGVGNGFVDAFDLDGNFIRRVASRGRLNSPWGLAIAPSTFGEFSGDLLVGSFGDGHIDAFDLDKSQGTGESQQRGQLHSADGKPLTIDGLWAIAFGNNAAAGPDTTLFFTAGPQGESHGLFGRINASH